VARRHALIVEAGGERFRFYYDREKPEILHITLRHGTTPADAIRTFFVGETVATEETHSRFETVTDLYGIYRARHAFDQSVISISCFELGDE
jgi:hypothetical protein